MRPLRICLIASSRFPIREPFAGGLEAHTHALAKELTRRGHRVTLFAAPGSDPALELGELPVRTFQSSAAARSDVGSPPEQWMQEHHAYLGLMLDLARNAHGFELVHNNSLHHLPLAMSESLPVPVVTTLHTPPVPWLESAAAFASPRSHFVAVSDFTARAWAHAVTSTPILNGIDTGAWLLGPGGEAAIWSGRLVPEKAPHHAIDAARAAGVPLVLAGPRMDESYFADEIAPRLGDDVIYAGHLSHRELREAVGRARVAVVTPSWDEPYGLVAAEAMACGTPVAAYARGALPEIVGPGAGALAAPDDVADLGRAILRAAARDRAEVRRHAVASCGLGRMVDEYEAVYGAALDVGLAA
ncbi:glycosyltransferase [Nocardioides pacificus]